MTATGFPLQPMTGSTIFRKLMFPGMLGLVLAIVMEFFKLFEEKPESAIELLRAWGPMSLMVPLALAVFAGIMNQFMDISRDGVNAQRQMAEAMGRNADKDDRQIQEIQTLTAFTAQESRGTRQQLEEVMTQLKSNSDAMARLIKKLEEREMTKGASA